MHPVLVFGGAFGRDIADWFLGNQDKIGTALGSIAGKIRDAVTGDSTILDRIGPALASIENKADLASKPNPEVLGILHQHTDAFANIERAIDHVQTGQDAIVGSLSSLTSLSMVTLGLSALTPTV